MPVILEVMSKAGTGSTFWIHLPARSADVPASRIGGDLADSVVDRVVTIRRTGSDARGDR